MYSIHTSTEEPNSRSPSSSSSLLSSENEIETDSDNQETDFLLGEKITHRKDKLSFKSQFMALLKKNYKIQLRSKKTNACIYIFTIIFLVYVFGIGLLVSKYLDKTIPENINPPSYSYDILDNKVINYSDLQFNSNYTFKSGLGPLVEELTLFTSRINKYKYPFSPGINELKDKSMMDRFLFQKFTRGSNLTLDGALLFHNLVLSNKDPTINFTVYYNSTDTRNLFIEMYKQAQAKGLTLYIPTYVNTVMRTSFEYIWKQDQSKDQNNLTDIMIGLKKFPQIKEKEVIDLMSFEQPFAFNFILHMLFPVFMVAVVYEKEHLLVDMMEMMGLKMEIYWLINFIFDWLLYILQMIIFYITLLILKFRFITQNDFSTHFILFLLWGNCLIFMAFFVSKFFKKVKTAYIVGIFLVIILTFVLPTYYWNISAQRDTSKISIFLMKCIPSISFVQALITISNASAIGQSGAKLSNANLGIRNIGSSYLMISVETIVLFFLTFYFNGGNLWLKKLFSNLRKKNKNKKNSSNTLDHSINNDDLLNKKSKDVKREDIRVKNCKDTIRILKLNKIFKGKDGNPNVHALSNFSLGIPTGIIFGLLGPNGAGKTTLMSILSGLISQTSGKAEICGLPLNGNNLHQIHKLISICPQHNCLWGNQTGKETLSFFARLHGFKGKNLKKRVDKILKELNLYKDREKLINKYSGGMKRRISLGIALIVDSKVVFLDEPTTGMDPSSKRKVWNVIQNNKKKRAIILTTHSMEEADALSDRIGIIARGQLKAIGHSQELKKRFGKGYKIVVQTSDTLKDLECHDFIMDLFPKAQLLNSLACNRQYEIPKKDVSLSKTFQIIENNKEKLGILDWGISQSTLEEVFLRITRESELDNF
ncbi:atp-binding cassette transporter subfamily a abca [Anaeramoeba flamelloides]|uniref:Atp-binding cassette transporter subfamily a abca n=1 Tax=Anaeramoeba flamelloides TaxID=1746091 RepID=A0ABQ8YHV6_9EUKA|nr:atp-binding cassette transporter subfamily a abca [Anaeramoeba flamelloides]